VVLHVVQIRVVAPRAVARVRAALVFHASPRPRMGAAAQPAAVADAAARPRDRAFFEGQYRSDVVPLYRCGAAKRQPVGLPNETLCHLHCPTIADRVTPIAYP
jgi:hypothetical protein